MKKIVGYGLLVICCGVLASCGNNESSPKEPENDSSIESSTSILEDLAKEKEEEDKLLEERKEKLNNKSNYREDITYDDLARRPEEYTSELVKFSGTVLQVIDDDLKTQLRVAMNDNLDTVVLVSFYTSDLPERLLEDDSITVYGESEGLVTYEATSGAQISIPSFNSSIIERISQ